MRQATICFLMLLWSAIAFGQEPQWRVIKHVSLVEQNLITEGNILIPTQPLGVYRLTIYFSVEGTGQGGFNADVTGLDISGQSFDKYIEGAVCPAGGFSSDAITVVLQPRQPLRYSISNNNPSNCNYSLIITVEQLVQQ